MVKIKMDAQSYAEYRATILLDRIKRLESEIKSSKEELMNLCKGFGISVILD